MQKNFSVRIKKIIVESTCSIFSPWSLLHDVFLSIFAVQKFGNCPTSNPLLSLHPFTFVVSLFTYFFLESSTVTEPQINMLAVQADLEEIVFKNKMLCDHARNPFTSEQVEASSSEDVIQHISEEKGPFSVRAVNIGACSQRKLPHGYGSLKTVTGKVIYSGDWRKGKMI